MTNVIQQFAVQLTPPESQVLVDLRNFVDWQTQSQIEMFTPQTVDDVAIRSYLLHLRLSGISESTSQRTVASLKRFYDWAQAAQLIIDSPFCRFDFNRPLLSREQIKRRQQTRFADPMDREITHLRALNYLAEHLNRSCDVRSLLATVVETLVQVMGLRTAWAFLWTEAGPHVTTGASDAPHDFALAACCGLPLGLERDDRGDLCRGPDCHCQRLLRAGQLNRAVKYCRMYPLAVLPSSWREYPRIAVPCVGASHLTEPTAGSDKHCDRTMGVPDIDRSAIPFGGSH